MAYRNLRGTLRPHRESAADRDLQPDELWAFNLLKEQARDNGIETAHFGHADLNMA
jgi:hypothetical protein